MQNFCYTKQLLMALLHVSLPPTHTCAWEWVRTFYYFLDILSSGPHSKCGPLFGATPWLHTLSMKRAVAFAPLERKVMLALFLHRTQ